MPMDEDTKSFVAIILVITMAALITSSVIGLLGYFSVQQRQHFILKCMAELGNNNVQFCSSIAK